MANFERAFCADPGRTSGSGGSSPLPAVDAAAAASEPDWAAKIHVACAPVYYHTYLYGNLVASQLRATLEREAGGLVGRREAGRLLAEQVFRPGESVRWDRLLARATGEPLTATHLARDIAAGPST
jgi:peptidyl-dipeptidase A